MAFDPVSGDLWLEENGDDSFSQLSRVPPGLNSGWVQIRGPVSRIAEYKAIETSRTASTVTVPGREPYQVKHRQLLAQSALARFQPGSTFSVRVDQSDPAKLVIG